MVEDNMIMQVKDIPTYIKYANNVCISFKRWEFHARDISKIYLTITVINVSEGGFWELEDQGHIEYNQRKRKGEGDIVTILNFSLKVPYALSYPLISEHNVGLPSLMM
jgi:hypothetical protein